MGNAGSLLTSPIVHLLLESLTNAPDLVKSVEATLVTRRCFVAG